MTEADVPQQVAIVGVVMNGDRTLVIRRSQGVPGEGYWSPVVGHVLEGESESSALVRELNERVGIRVQPVRRVWETNTEDKTHVLRWWLADYIDGEAVAEGAEVGEVDWIAPAEFGALEKTYAGDRHFYSEVFPQLKHQST